MSGKRYGVVCESETGVNIFGHPNGRPILMESVGDLSLTDAEDKAAQFNASGQFGRTVIVELVVHKFPF